MRRTLLFLPGNNPNMIMNGGLLGSDSIILDLEDAVAPDNKDEARELVACALGSLDFGSCDIIVRVNGLDTPYWKEDLKRIVPCKPFAIMPAKVSSAEYLLAYDEEITRLEQICGLENGTIKLIALIETAQGLENAYAIASASSRVEGIFLGAEDLTADLQCERTREGGEIAYARARMVSAARAAGVEAYDTPFTNVEDPEGLEADTRTGKALGFSGKSAINPRQVARINKIYSPTQKQIQYAKEVFRAIAEGKEQGKGAVALHGKMIDAPIVQRAKTVLDTARLLGLEDENE